MLFTNRPTQRFTRNQLGELQIPEARGEIRGEIIIGELPRPEWETFENSIGMTLVRVPRGEFQMGSSLSVSQLASRFGAPRESERDLAAEHPRHRVQITDGFYMAQHEVTTKQFRSFFDATGFEVETVFSGRGRELRGIGETYNWQNTGFPQGEQHPVVNVSWNDAQEFCKWLSRKEGRIYRLPTEAEWEYACRGGTSSLFWNGGSSGSLAAIGNVADRTLKKNFPPHKTAIASDDGHYTTAPVGSFRPNPFGLFDMHGNVAEWCSDWCGTKYYSQSPVRNPRGPYLLSESGTPKSDVACRMVRGGSWRDGGLNARSAARNWNSPGHTSNDLGFRVVCEEP